MPIFAILNVTTVEFDHLSRNSDNSSFRIWSCFTVITNTASFINNCYLFPFTNHFHWAKYMEKLQIWVQMLPVNSCLVPIYPLTVHLGFGSSVNWQHTVAQETQQMLGAAQSTASAWPPFSPWRGNRHSTAGKYQRGPSLHHAQHPRAWNSLLASGRIQSRLPLLWVLMALGCWELGSSKSFLVLLLSTASWQYRAVKPGREPEPSFWYSLSHHGKVVNTLFQWVADRPESNNTP